MNKIALAHHRDDNVETILMRFIRGTGIKGLRGISPKREDGVIRPFLSIGKAEILEYCDTHKLSHKLDKTNLEPKYHRNKLRLELIPHIEEFNPNFSKGNSSSLGAISAEYYDFIQKCTQDAMTKVVINGKIDLEKFDQLHLCIKKEILIALLQGLDREISIAYHHIEIIFTQLEDRDKTTWVLDMPNDIQVVRQYNELFFRKRQDGKGNKAYTYELTPGKVFLFPKIGHCLHIEILSMDEYKTIKPSPTSGAFDYDVIKARGERILLRSRRDGDRIEPIGMKGAKKVKNIFIDKKVPVDRRWKIPLLCVDNDVIWIVGYHKSRKFQLRGDTENVLFVSFDKYEEAKMNNDIEKILISEDDIKAKVEELGKVLSQDYKDKFPLVICDIKRCRCLYV